jgi:hypothetical protein
LFDVSETLLEVSTVLVFHAEGLLGITASVFALLQV